MMWGMEVAKSLDEAGLLVRDHVLPEYRNAGVVMEAEPTHWMVKFVYDGVTSLANNSNRYFYAPHGLDTEVKDWLHALNMTYSKRRFQKVWARKSSASRACTMVKNWGKDWGITAELVGVAFVEVA